MAVQLGSAFGKVELDISSVKQGVTEANASLKNLDEGAGSASGALERFGGVAQVAVTAGIGALVAGLQQSVEAAMEGQRIMAQTEAVIRSTGGAAGISSTQIEKMSLSLSDMSTYGHDTIQSMENILLTFPQIKGDTFKEASQAVLDMSTALGEDLQSAAIQVGKALQDPVQGITALRRVGVNFSDDQKKVIQELVNTGQAAEAQRIILRELATEFGGSAAAAADTMAGKLAHANDAIDRMKEAIGERFLPVLGQAADAFTTLMTGQEKINDAFDGTAKKIEQEKPTYEDYKSSLIATARAAGLIQDVYRTGQGVVTEYDAQVKILTEDEWNQAHGIAASNESMTGQETTLRRSMAAMKEVNTVQQESIHQSETERFGLQQLAEARTRTGEAEKQYQEVVKETTDAIKAQNAVVADTMGMAIQYTEAEQKQADVKAKLDELNAKIAARGPARVTTVVAEAKSTAELSMANSALTAARNAADDTLRRSNESSAQYAMRLKDAQTNLKKLTEQMDGHIVTAINLNTTDQKTALNQARLAAATEDLAKVQRKKGETDAEFMLRVETLKGKIADYSKTLEAHTSTVGGATKAELEQKKALEEQIFALQKSDEVAKAKGAFDALTASFRAGTLTQAEYQERATALNAITHLYSPSALSAATAQETFMKALADPKTDAWKTQLDKNRTAIDGVTDAEQQAADKAKTTADQESDAAQKVYDANTKKIQAAKDYRQELLQFPKEIETTVTTTYKTVTAGDQIKAAGGDSIAERAKQVRAAQDSEKATTNVTERAAQAADDAAKKTSASLTDAATKTGTAVGKMVNDSITKMRELLNAGIDPTTLGVLDQDRTVQALTISWSLVPREVTTVYTIVTKGEAPSPRAAGGPVVAGQAYIVGERRPELFIPNVSGQIVPSVPAAVYGTDVMRNQGGPRTVINHNETMVFQDALSTKIVLEQQRLERIRSTVEAM